MFNVTIRNEGDSFLGSLEVDSYFFEPEKYDYAFYLFRNEERISTKMYSNDMEVSFSEDFEAGIFYIRCFIRDKTDASIRAYNSKKLTSQINFL